ncbi:hypothetical protein FPOA_13344 [Fusarium poae]|uniref:Uncharacterized protein n=1 Tax=Fusarium poae TaxID=36050 RepID=A0A1B8A628_FUSPO|nr:hypothetical protein FPOA_13344 [Fusarium poae]
MAVEKWDEVVRQAEEAARRLEPQLLHNKQIGDIIANAEVNFTQRFNKLLQIKSQTQFDMMTMQCSSHYWYTAMMLVLDWQSSLTLPGYCHSLDICQVPSQSIAMI